MRGLLSGGLADEFGGVARGAGLQRDLLRECQRFSQRDFDFLYERIRGASAPRSASPRTSFMARVQELGTGALVLPATSPSPP